MISDNTGFVAHSVRLNASYFRKAQKRYTQLTSVLLVNIGGYKKWQNYAKIVTKSFLSLPVKLYVRNLSLKELNS